MRQRCVVDRWVSLYSGLYHGLVEGGAREYLQLEGRSDAQQQHCDMCEDAHVECSKDNEVGNTIQECVGNGSA